MNTSSFLPLQLLPISVVVCTFNEEDNIGDCIDTIKRNNPSEIIVVDGSSDDKTTQIAAEKGVEIKICKRKGLAYQRYIGVEMAKQPYIAFIDADDRIDRDSLSVSLNELKIFDWKAIGLQRGPFNPSSYWEKAMGFLDEAYHNTPGPSIMVGRPSLYEKKTLIEIGLDKTWGADIGNEDTDLSIRYEQQNIPMGIGTGKALRRHPTSLKASLKSWVKYGKGDAKISLKHPHKRKNMLNQVSKKYFGKMTRTAIRKRKLKYIPFIWMMGITRFVVSLWFLTFFISKLGFSK